MHIPANIDEKIQIRDYRAVVGLRREGGGVTGFVEAGWVFARAAEFLHGTPGFQTSPIRQLHRPDWGCGFRRAATLHRKCAAGSAFLAAGALELSPAAATRLNQHFLIPVIFQLG